jgi:hypothetical protein
MRAVQPGETSTTSEAFDRLIVRMRRASDDRHPRGDSFSTAAPMPPFVASFALVKRHDDDSRMGVKQRDDAAVAVMEE